MHIIFTLIILLITGLVSAQVEKAPLIDEGDGPHTQLIIRGVTLINGAGSPPRGPVDIIIEDDIIKNIRSVGYPGVAIDEERRPQLKEGGKEINAEGKYLLPGLIDMHGHIGGKSQGCLLYTSPSPRDATLSRMPSSA